MSTKKILVIGQAPPAVEQKVPYDTTMLYTWLRECGISKEKAQEMFDFDAVYDKFPGHGSSGHKVPTYQQMVDYYSRELRVKIIKADKIIILGSVARNFLQDNDFLKGRQVLYLMHPSLMNYNRYIADKNKIIQPLKDFLNFES